MAILVPCRSAALKALISADDMAMGASKVARLFQGQTPKAPEFFHYGASKAHNEAICRSLNRAAARFTQSARRSDPSQNLYLNFSPGDDYILVSSVNGNKSHGTSLDRYLPYLISLTPRELCNVVLKSAGGKGHGEMPFDFFPQEETFLRTIAIPAIVDAKIEEAVVQGKELVRFSIKSLGIGYYGSEFGPVLETLLKQVAKRKDFKGAVVVECIGFDIDMWVLNASHEYINPSLHGAVRAGGVIAERVEVRYNDYHGDLSDPLLLSAMLAFGKPDIALWRNTHIVANGIVSREYGDSIIWGLGRYVQRPGAILVREGIASSEDRFFIQELIV